MIDELKKNIDTEIEMLREISNYAGRLEGATEEETKLLQRTIHSLRLGMRIINSAIPNILMEIPATKKLPRYFEKEKRYQQEFERVKFKRISQEIEVVLKSNDKERFLKELNISEQFIKKLRKEEEEKERYSEFKASRGYLKLANKIFLETAKKYAKKGYFKELAVSIRKANVDILFESYVAMVFLSVFLSIIISIFITVSLLLFETSPLWPFFELRSSGYIKAIAKFLWIPFVVPVLVFLGLYFYPSTERKSIGNKIDRELPFAVIHMSAISGSGIEPSEIFRIIGLSKEYPYLRREIRKVLNQINLYGYDLTTALNNASKTAPSENLTELFAGLSTTITSGANLSEFFEKRAESLLLGYRLEREKYTRLVETFLDIYISIVIAAPMIFLLLLIMMAVSGISIGLEPYQISLLAVFTISLLNIVFLIFLHIKQPSY